MNSNQLNHIHKRRYVDIRSMINPAYYEVPPVPTSVVHSTSKRALDQINELSTTIDLDINKLSTGVDKLFAGTDQLSADLSGVRVELSSFAKGILASVRELSDNVLTLIEENSRYRSEDIGSVNRNVSAVSDQISSLNGIVGSLNEKISNELGSVKGVQLEMQASINQLTERVDQLMKICGDTYAVVKDIDFVE
jgi:archaellum component FlaC